MEKVRVKEIIDKHEQKQDFSCIPSAVEMILKLEGLVNLDYYEEQDSYTYKQGNSFSLYDGKILINLKFRHLFYIIRNVKFPLEELFDTIQRELNSNKFIAISLSESYDNNGATGNFHNYIVHSCNNNEFQSLSKKDKETIFCDFIKLWVKNMKGSDILVYERIEAVS
jgi:hypothetical protein